MFKRFNTRYSLWPEPVRPRRSTSPLTPAVGGFVVGVAFAIAVYSFPDVDISAAGEQPPALSELGHAPIVMPEVAPQPAVEAARRFRQTPTPAAKLELPVTGSRAPLPGAATDKHGGKGQTTGTIAALAVGSTPSLGADDARPAAAEHLVKPHKKIVRKKRTRPTRHAVRHHHRRKRLTRHAVRHRQKRRWTARYAAEYRQWPMYSIATQRAWFRHTFRRR
ncbi:MAG: hypothetical protein WB822_15735 [Rhodoplanes sp.]